LVLHFCSVNAFLPFSVSFPYSIPHTEADVIRFAPVICVSFGVVSISSSLVFFLAFSSVSDPAPYYGHDPSCAAFSLLPPSGRQDLASRHSLFCVSRLSLIFIILFCLGPAKLSGVRSPLLPLVLFSLRLIPMIEGPFPPPDLHRPPFFLFFTFPAILRHETLLGVIFTPHLRGAQRPPIQFLSKRSWTSSSYQTLRCPLICHEMPIPPLCASHARRLPHPSLPPIKPPFEFLYFN